MSDSNALSGKVYVFNSYNEAISSLSIHGYAAGSIKAWAAKTTENPYQPCALEVGRVRHADELSSAGFAYGDNQIVIPWDSFQGTATIKIPSPADRVSGDDDLILYVCVNKAILLDARGFVLDTFDVTTD